MPLFKKLPIPMHLSPDERTILLSVEDFVNGACMAPTETWDTTVVIPFVLFGHQVTEEILAALQKMHAVVGERASFSREPDCWKFTVHCDSAKAVAQDWTLAMAT
jgi:hypothetical protein